MLQRGAKMCALGFSCEHRKSIMTSNIFRSLFYVIANATHSQLAQQIKYLKVENEILRSKLPQRITVTRPERQRLLKFGAKLGKAIESLVSIVKPKTFMVWIREAKRGFRDLNKSVRRGRKRTSLSLCRLILKMARENSWGYTRIIGELKKLGIKPPSKNTVKRILKSRGFEPGPNRGEST